MHAKRQRFESAAEMGSPELTWKKTTWARRCPRSSLLLLLKLEIPVQFGLDIDDTVEELGDDLISVSFECLVEFFELLFGLLVYGGLGTGSGALVLITIKRRDEQE